MSIVPDDETPTVEVLHYCPDQEVEAVGALGSDAGPLYSRSIGSPYEGQGVTP
jgi:hypothetical protein